LTTKFKKISLFPLFKCFKDTPSLLRIEIDSEKREGMQGMGTVSLVLLVLVLGIRHGLDADHLAYIDGLTRYNWRVGNPVARWVGTLFSLGHGLVVAIVAVILGTISHTFTYPAYFDVIGTWVSIVSLFLIGTLNIYNLLRSRADDEADFQLTGLKSKFFGRFGRETTNPFVIVLSGVLFALAADTVSQTSVWAIVAGNSEAKFLPVVLGLTFLLGMMLTDTIDSWIVYRMITHSGKLGQTASRAMGWVIVALAYGVSGYEGFTFFFPLAEVDFEIVGVVLFTFLVICFTVLALRSKSSAVPASKEE
jgi:nickel/cobalt transporter (NiCoT) family protein